MNYKEFIEKRNKLIRLIESKRTGTAEELADLLNCSRRTVFNYLDVLDSEGMNIKFSRVRNTYYFEERGE